MHICAAGYKNFMHLRNPSSYGVIPTIEKFPCSSRIYVWIDVFVASQEKFYAEADKDYWKSIMELIPKEVPTIETRKGKKDQEKEPSTTLVVQGPKPGKRTDLARMRQILIKLKHDTPLHLKPSPPSAVDAKTEAPVVASSSESVTVV